MDTQERFLQRKDYGTIIQEAYLLQIIKEVDAALPLAEDAAIAEMKPYLARYDT